MNWNLNESKKLRLAMFYGCLYFETFFRSIFLNFFKKNEKDKSFEKFALSLLTDKYWASELNILLCSIVLKKPIHVYEILKEDHFLSGLFSAHYLLFDENPINIGFNRNHFVAILPLIEGAISPMPNEHNFKDFQVNTIDIF